MLEGVQALTEGLMELEAEQQVGAGKCEKSAEQKGYHTWSRDTRVGSIELSISSLNRVGKPSVRAYVRLNQPHSMRWWLWFRKDKYKGHRWANTVRQ